MAEHSCKYDVSGWSGLPCEGDLHKVRRVTNSRDMHNDVFDFICCSRHLELIRAQRVVPGCAITYTNLGVVRKMPSRASAGETPEE